MKDQPFDKLRARRPTLQQAQGRRTKDQSRLSLSDCLLAVVFTFCVLSVVFAASLSYAESKGAVTTNPRVQNMSGEDREMFGSLTAKQQKDIRESRIRTGYNHPVYSDYEQVWLYTKTQEDKKVTEDEIIDPVTNWPSLHRYVWAKTCQEGDFFVLFDRGVVEKIVPDTSRKVYGSCNIKTHEEFIPIVNEKDQKRRRSVK